MCVRICGITEWVCAGWNVRGDVGARVRANIKIRELGLGVVSDHKRNVIPIHKRVYVLVVLLNGHSGCNVRDDV